MNKIEFLPRTICPLHGHPDDKATGKLSHFASVYDELTGQEFNILRCPVCDAMLTDPYPSEVTAKFLYEGRASAAMFDVINGTVIDKLKDYFARRDIRHIHAFAGRPKVNNILDFGTGNGRFAIAGKCCFPAATIDAVDFDVNPPPMFTRFGQGVRYLDFETFFNSSDRYDLIILRHVIEHHHDPQRLLQLLKQRLLPSGILYLETTNVESAFFYYFGSRCNAFFVPYHLFNFSSASIEALIRTAGLKPYVFMNSVPLAGTVLASLLGRDRTFFFQFSGILLHPVQKALELYRGKPHLAVICRS